MTIELATLLLNRLAGAWFESVTGGLVTVLVVGSICRCIDRFLPPALRCWLWWLICARLFAMAIGGFIAIPRFTIPVSLPVVARSNQQEELAVRDAEGESESATERVTNIAPQEKGAHAASTMQPESRARPTAVAYVFLFWAFGVMISLGLCARESLKLGRSLREGRDMSATALGGELRVLSMQMGISAPPKLVEFAGASSPFVAGLIRPVLAVPAGLDAALSPEQSRMALAHELAHIRRGDLYLAIVPLVARALWFCVPIIPGFACSEWATAREADCDSRAMAATGAAPGAYSQVLVTILRGDASAHRPPPFAFGATASFHTLRTRLQLIRDGHLARRASPALMATIVVLAGCAIVPWRAGSAVETAPLSPRLPLTTPEGANDVDDVTAFSTLAGNDPDKRYILIGAQSGHHPPPEGYRLLVVLPGGAGGADFNFFVRRLHKQALGEDYLVAELVAKQWDTRQAEELVWPTRTNPWPSMRFSTEDFADAVVRDVEARYPINRRHVFSLSWASGGPAGYALSMTPGTPIAGSLIAMSTFSPDALPALAGARGHSYYLLHPGDAEIVPVTIAENARDLLRQNGADVELATYTGGYGWNGDVYGQVHRGIGYLVDHTN